MSLRILVRLSAAIVMLSVSMTAPRAQVVIGGDVYHAGANATVTATAARDAFVAGFTARLAGNVGGDGLAAGFDVDVDATIGSDLYANGASVTVNGPVGEDVTAAGGTIRLRSGATVGGNVRLMGGSLSIEAPVSGSLVATGGSISLDAPVQGDVRLTGAEITFGDNARIAGNLTYTAPEEIGIPASVIAEDRIRFVAGEHGHPFADWRDMAGKPQRLFLPTLFSAVWAFVVTLAFLLAIAAVFFAVAPGTVEKGRRRIVEHPGASLLAGFLALATLIGLVPVSAMTVIGIPLIPIVILVMVLAWTLAYALGIHALSMRVATAFWEVEQTTVAKLLVMAAGLVGMAVLNFIPFVGWIVNFTVVLLGLGAIVRLLTGWMSSTPAVVENTETAGPGT